jgi:hypothetical protein
MLRFGVEFADGRKATNVGQDSRSEGEPQNPVLWGRGGGGSGARWQTFWMWPLPPSGPLSFGCEWPAAGIPLSRAQIEGQSIIDVRDQLGGPATFDGSALALSGSTTSDTNGSIANTTFQVPAGGAVAGLSR